jgi:hypothetical protein
MGAIFVVLEAPTFNEFMFFVINSHTNLCEGVKMWPLNIIVLKKVMPNDQVQLLFTYNKNYYHLLTLLQLSFINFTTIIIY